MTAVCFRVALLLLVTTSGCLSIFDTADAPSAGTGGSKHVDGGLTGDGWVSAGGIGGADSGNDAVVESGSGAATAIGCADGIREAFLDLSAEPDVAGCFGGFSVAGVVSDDSRQIKCGRNAGNNSSNPNGTGCSVADLCADGWHVCEDSADFEAKLTSKGCPGDVSGDYFLATRQHMTDKVVCTYNSLEDNNVIGCGKSLAWLESVGLDKGCGLLDSQLKCSHCDGSGVWSCSDCNHEGSVVAKSGPTLGGVLCCRD